MKAIKNEFKKIIREGKVYWRKKDVFVWVARDNTDSKYGDAIFIFNKKPKLSKPGVWMPDDTDSNYHNIRNIHTLFGLEGIKKGECKKYKLVEVKE